MSIRPIDTQIVVHKSQEIHHGKQHVINKQDNDLIQAQLQNKVEAKKKMQQVEKSKDLVVRHVQDEEERRRKKRQQDHPKKKDPMKYRGLKFDAKI